MEAALRGDLAMLRCLRRLGCPWGDAFAAAVRRQECGLAALRALLAAGCHVAWEPVLRSVCFFRKRDGPEVLAWLARERRARQGVLGADGEVRGWKEADVDGSPACGTEQE